MQNRTQNRDNAAELQERFVQIRKYQGSKHEVAADWNMLIPTVYSLETRVREALQVVANHADRLGIIVEYNIRLRKNDNGRPRKDDPAP